jgi:hypothetical protein
MARAMLELSAATRVPMHVSPALLLTGGLVNGFLGHWWGHGWIWIALGLIAAGGHPRLADCVLLPACSGLPPIRRTAPIQKSIACSCSDRRSQ